MSGESLLVFIGAVLALLSLPGTCELAMLTLGAMLSGKSDAPAAAGQSGLKLCVLIPAHDEEDGIGACVASLLSCERGPHGLSLVVIADNCADATAAAAAAAGAQVLERFDADLRGKGYALAYAFDRLADSNFDAYIVVDADTRVEGNFIIAMAERLLAGADAVQCRYLVDNPDASLRTRLMHIAWLAFNDLRPRGREFFGLSVGILGNGFALSRKALASAPFRAGSIAEDLEYHLRLIRSGERVRFCPGATVWSPMPTAGSAAASQRARWEGGRMRMILEQAPGLAREAASGRMALVEPLLELLLLPLAFHALLLLLALIFPWAPGRAYALVGLAVMGWHVAVALWLGKAGWRYVLALATAPAYILWKLTLGRRILASSKSDAPWVRTERERSDDRA